MASPHETLLRRRYFCVSAMLLTLLFAALSPPVVAEREESECADASMKGAGKEIQHLCDGYFMKIRKAYGDEDLSKLLEASGIDLTSSGEGGAGKSGANFLKTTDGKYFLKTMTKRDLDAWKAAAEVYTKHMIDNVKTTTIVRFIGILKTPTGKVWLVMNNCLPASYDFPVVYDLKGSWVGRAQKKKDKLGNYKVGLDLDWKEKGLRMHVDEKTQVSILDTLMKDADFLWRPELLDYSLIVGQASFALKRCEPNACIAPVCDERIGCVDVAHKQEDPMYMAVKESYCDVRADGSAVVKERTRHGCLATLVADAKQPQSGEVTLHFECFGIIDLLKPWDKKAVSEHFALALVEDFNGVSCQEPRFYAGRFYEAMRDECFTQDVEEFRAKLPKINDSTCSAWGTSDLRILKRSDDFVKDVGDHPFSLGLIPADMENEVDAHSEWGISEWGRFSKMQEEMIAFVTRAEPIRAGYFVLGTLITSSVKYSVTHLFEVVARREEFQGDFRSLEREMQFFGPFEPHDYDLAEADWFDCFTPICSDSAKTFAWRSPRFDGGALIFKDQSGVATVFRAFTLLSDKRSIVDKKSLLAYQSEH